MTNRPPLPPVALTPPALAAPKTVVESVEIIPAEPALPAEPEKQFCMGDSHLILDILRAHFGDDGGRMQAGVEVGVHRGATSAKLLRQFPNLVLWLVDPYSASKKDSPYFQSGDGIAKLTREQQHKHYLAAKAATEFAANRRAFCKFPSVEAAKIIPTPRFSFIFVDDDHSLEGARASIAAWWPRVEAQGILALHDYGHPRNDGRGFGVKQAADEFAQNTGLVLETRGSIAFFVKR